MEAAEQLGGQNGAGGRQQEGILLSKKTSNLVLLNAILWVNKEATEGRTTCIWRTDSFALEKASKDNTSIHFFCT